MVSLKIPRDIRSFVRVASLAAQREILRGRRTTVLLGDDVIDLERKQRNVHRDLAVLATAIRAGPN